MIPILGNIFAPQNVKGEPRHAENADTRQEIRRHDPDQQRKKGGKEEHKEDDQFKDGSTGMVAVEALRIFLQNFLKSLETEENAAPSGAQNTGTPAPASSRAAMAANAYEHTAQARHNSSLLHAADTKDEETPALQLDAKDIRTIHEILADLLALQASDIEYLYIERKETFLQSIVSAVEAAKNGQSFEI